jgi:hypothetical protein
LYSHDILQVATIMQAPAFLIRSLSYSLLPRSKKLPHQQSTTRSSYQLCNYYHKKE